MNDYKRSSNMFEVQILFYLKSSIYLSSKVLIFLMTFNLLIGICENKFTFKERTSDMLSTDLTKEITHSKFVNFGIINFKQKLQDRLSIRRNIFLTK